MQNGSYFRAQFESPYRVHLTIKPEAEMAGRGLGAAGALQLSLLISTLQSISAFQAASSFRPGPCTASPRFWNSQLCVAARNVPRMARGGIRAGLPDLAMSASPAATGAMTIQYKTINIKTGPGKPPR